jgi:uncharacterized protein
MGNIFDKLRSLQEILSKKYEIEREIEEIPKNLSTKIELLNRLKKTFIKKNEEFENAKNRIKELRQKTIDAEIIREKYEKQMDIIKTQREYEALDKEIKMATELEQNLRRDMQNQEKIVVEMKETMQKEEQLIQKQEEEIKTEQSRIKQEKKEKTKLLNKFEKEESKITPDLDEEILFKFERIIKNKSGLGIVPIIDGVCTGCHMILPPQYVNNVRSGKDIMFCTECSRILYYQDEEKLEQVEESIEDIL